MKKALILTIGLIAEAAVQANLKDATKVLTTLGSGLCMRVMSGCASASMVDMV